jgi:adhesin/invasin
MARWLHSVRSSLLLRPLLLTATLAVVAPVATAAAQTTLHFIQEPPLTLLSGQVFSVQVEARNSSGDPDPSFSPNVQLSLVGGGSLSGSTSLKVESDGVARFTGLSIAQAGTYRIVATGGSATPDTSNTVIVLASTNATELRFVDQPSTAEAGETISTVTVRAVNVLGTTDPTFNGNVTISIGSNPGGGTLSGTTTVAAVNGVATFDDLSINRAGSGYTLNAASTGLTGATSASFSITPGDASGTTSQITASPTSIPADGTSTSTITVALRDAAGSPLTSGGDAVALTTTAGTLGPVSDNGNGTYTATLTAPSTAGSATVSGTVNGATITDTAEVTFTPRGPSTATSIITASPTTVPADGASTSTITVELRDSAGNPLTTGGAAVEVFTTAGTFGPVTDHGNGTYTSTLTAPSSTTTTTATVRATVGGALITDTATVTFTGVAPTATRLVFGQQPTDEQAGATISPAVTVRAVDGNGATVTSFTGNVTMAIGTNPGGGTLSGTTTVAAVSGVATFSNLSINRAGSGYTLTAAASGMTGATSVPFSITPGPASGATSTITASPTSVPANGSSSSTITVELRDALGNRVTTGGAVVALTTTAGTLGPVTNHGDGTYTAELTAPSSPATATVSGTVGGAPISDTATVTFTLVSPAAIRLVFGQQPTDTQAGASITPAVTVRAVDNGGALVTSFNGAVTIDIGTNPAGGDLSGTTTVTAISGVATFSNLSIDRAGSGYRLSASASGATGGTSAPFAITPGPASTISSSVSAQPSSIPADGSSTSTITVEVRDALGNRRTSGGDAVTLTTTAGTLSAVTHLGNGLYTATLTAASTPGTATVTGRIAGAVITDTAVVTFTSASQTATRLLFGVQPTSTPEGAVISPAVTVRAVDAGGATVPSFTGGITIALGTNPSGGTLSGTTTVAAVGGVATFGNLSIDEAGAGYTLAASSGGLSGATSNPFAVTTSTSGSTDLAVTASVDDATPAVGDTVVYTIRVTNQGSSQATSVEVSYALSERLMFVSSVPSQGNYNPQLDVWTVGTLDPGEGATLEIEARVQR